MNRLLGVLLLTTGCTVLPGARDPAEERAAPPPSPLHAARVGVELLPPSEDPVPLAASARTDTDSLAFAAHERHAHAPSVETAHDVTPTVYRREPPSTRVRAEREPWDLTDRQLREIRDPVERFTVKFVKEVLGEDRHRVQRHLGAPLLFHQSRQVESDPVTRTRLDEYDIEDNAQRLARSGPGLLNKPLRSALRWATPARDIELWFDDVKENNFSLAALAGRGHDHPDWGRLSMRVRATNFKDPVEVTYVHSGWRIGSGSEQLKVTYGRALSETVSVWVRSRFRYGDAQLDLWADLLWQANPHTGVHFVVGNKVDPTSGSALLPLVQSPVLLPASEASPGFLFYVEHLF